MNENLLAETISNALSRVSENPAAGAIYNVNTCFICHVNATETTLKRCGACKMISYCGEAHQKQDWKYHKELCGVFQKVEKNLAALQANLGDKEVWFKYRCMFADLCGREMQRKLFPHELQMIACPKRCEICRSINANIICHKCLCVNYCSEEHRDRDSEFHAENCDDLKLAMDIDICKAPDRIRFNWSWTLRKRVLKLPEKIIDFVRSSIIMGKLNHDRKDIAELQISGDITFSLSLVNGLKLLNFEVKDKLVVHVVGAELQETAILNKWEIILHIYPQIKNLIIFFIGPQVGMAFKQDMCTSCRKIFKFKCIKDLYHDFVKSSEYQKPDIVCTFNPGYYHTKYPWSKTLPLLFEHAPLIMTSFNKLEVEMDTKLLLDVNPNLVIKTMKNSFASLMPMRGMEDTVVSYFNNFITVIFKPSQKGEFQEN